MRAVTRLASRVTDVTGLAREQSESCNTLIASSVKHVTSLAISFRWNRPAGSIIMECNKLMGLWGTVRAVTCLASSVTDVTGLAREQTESCSVLSQERN